MSKIYIAIDLKSFYASVECIERNLNPLNTNLVVADKSRTEKTICLAVTPALKSIGVPGRPRLFEVIAKVKKANEKRLMASNIKAFAGKSTDIEKIGANKDLEIDYIVAKPQMAKYIEISSKIYDVYLKYVAKEDIHVYSIDEVFIDISSYLSLYKISAYDLCQKIILNVLQETGITATAGIGTNLYLCKIAMDIVAKHSVADENGVRIAYLDERLYREKLWTHRPISDFWRVGSGYEKRLASLGLYTMGDIAKCSLGSPLDFYNEDLLYKTFGVNAELLIDHAWGFENVEIKDIKSYKPEHNSLGQGQVLQCPYPYDKARIVILEMADMLSLDLVDKGLITRQIVITIGYDAENLKDKDKTYTGEIKQDSYGRDIPKHAHGTINFEYTSSTNILCKKSIELFDRIANKDLTVRKLNITACFVISEKAYHKEQKQKQEQKSKDPYQTDLFAMLDVGLDSNSNKQSTAKNISGAGAGVSSCSNANSKLGTVACKSIGVGASAGSCRDTVSRTYGKDNQGSATYSDELDAKSLEKERKRQKALLAIKKKFGKNAILKGFNFEDGATAKERNRQIGGHKA